MSWSDLGIVVCGILLSACLGGCGDVGSVVHDLINVADAVVTGAATGVELGSAAAAVSGYGSRAVPTPANLPYRGTPGTASTSGYNQRQSFEDCATTYGAAGLSGYAAQCQSRASNMGSMD